MTEMAPEQPIPDEEGEAFSIEADGHYDDGRITVEMKLGTAKLTLEFDSEDGEAADVLIALAPEASEKVLAALVAKQEALRG